MMELLLGAFLLIPSNADKVAGPDEEYKTAEVFLYGGKFPAEDTKFIRFFTTYSIPQAYEVRGEKVELRKLAEKVLPFVLNSTASVKADSYIYKPKRVPGSETLWYTDIRDYFWKTEDIDSVFKIQPYFLTPLVVGDNTNMMFRADWFIVNAMDVTKQDDRGIKDIVYYTLQYGLGKAPKNAAEFEDFWKVDLKTIRDEKLETGTIVDAGDSAVSNHTRQLRRARTLFGYYHATRDVKSHDFDLKKVITRDYIEEIFAKQSDAGEYISTNKRGLQTYLLTAGVNDKFKRVESGDVGVVVDRSDIVDPRVRTGKSCVICHGVGIIPPTNAISELIRVGGELRAYDKELSRLIKSFYLKNHNSLVEDDNRIFERAVKECNGLDGIANAKAFSILYDWYWNKKVTIEQAALECGQTVDVYRENIKAATTGRLVFLHKGKGMPREVWDSVNLGGYVQSMLLSKRIQAKPDVAVVEVEKVVWPPQMKVLVKTRTVKVIVTKAKLSNSANELVVYVPFESTVTILKEGKDWYFVKFGKNEGFVKKSSVKSG